MQDPRAKFQAIYNQYIRREGAQPFWDWLCSTDFFTAPASTRYHSAFPGGLVMHSLHVYDRLCRNLYHEWLATHTQSEAFPMERLESITIVALLHDICKADFYTTEMRSRKVYSETGSQKDGQGRYEWESFPFYKINEKFPFGHGEKSVYLINEHMKLTREEALSIRWHMGDFSDLSTAKAYELCPLAVHLHIADLEATYLDERLTGDERVNA